MDFQAAVISVYFVLLRFIWKLLLLFYYYLLLVTVISLRGKCLCTNYVITGVKPEFCLSKGQDTSQMVVLIN